MKRSSQLNRADFLACLQRCGTAQRQDWAASLGYVPQPEILQPSAPIKKKLSPAAAAPSSPSLAVAEAPTLRQFPRVVAWEARTPPQESFTEPKWYQEAIPWKEEDDGLSANLPLQPPPHQPLMPWPRLWPFLKTALGAALASVQLDLPPIVQLPGAWADVAAFAA